MNRVVGKVEEERIIFLTINELDRLLGQSGGQVSMVVTFGKALLVAVDGLLIISLHANQLKVIMSASTHKLVALVKASILRMPLEFWKVLIQPKVPLANCG